jgi:hypothetical protein
VSGWEWRLSPERRGHCSCTGRSCGGVSVGRRRGRGCRGVLSSEVEPDLREKIWLKRRFVRVRRGGAVDRSPGEGVWREHNRRATVSVGELGQVRHQVHDPLRLSAVWDRDHNVIFKGNMENFPGKLLRLRACITNTVSLLLKNC